jgi:hypothetical protein
LLNSFSDFTCGLGRHYPRLDPSLDAGEKNSLHKFTSVVIGHLWFN